jgi:hypothetical protein
MAAALSEMAFFEKSPARGGGFPVDLVCLAQQQDQDDQRNRNSDQPE